MQSLLSRLPLLAIITAISACTATIKAPENIDKARVTFLLEHGRHTTLVLVNRDGVPVRYAFGELDWYAYSNTGFLRGMSALLRPTSGTLGRRELEVEPTIASIRKATGIPIEIVHCIAASARHVDRLGMLLDTAFYENIDTVHFNPDMNLDFVKVPERYWFGNNSNTAAADWVEKLGGEVSGTTIFANWRVVYPKGSVPEVCLDAAKDSGLSAMNDTD